ncbi:MAG: metal-dependent hydrolase [Rhodobacteraceae bacterium]|nr:metal-dependent hydrolase [Paracoccaceae bacterium]
MQVTWYGHSAFRVEFGSNVVLIDPFLSGNPKFEGKLEDAAKGATHVLVTHGHADHLGDSVEIAKTTGAQVVSNFEICDYLGAKGVTNLNPGNTGGEVECGDFSVAFTQAHHSSGIFENGTNAYLGNPNGLIIRPNDGPSLFHMGDTAIFSDMSLIQEFYAPDFGIVPVGDRFTMDGKTAAIAVKRYFKFSKVIPCHYGTFDLLDPSADTFVEGLNGSGIQVLTPQPGDTFAV